MLVSAGLAMECRRERGLEHTAGRACTRVTAVIKVVMMVLNCIFGLALVGGGLCCKVVNAMA